MSFINVLFEIEMFKIGLNIKYKLIGFELFMN